MEKKGEAFQPLCSRMRIHGVIKFANKQQQL